VKKIVAVMLLAVAGCNCPPTAVDVGQLGPLVDVVADRHDAMLAGSLDPATISEADRATFFRSTEILRSVVNQARANSPVR